MSDRDQGSAEEEEYVLLDLEDVFHGLALPTNTPYTISVCEIELPVCRGRSSEVSGVDFFSPTVCRMAGVGYSESGAQHRRPQAGSFALLIHQLAPYGCCYSLVLLECHVWQIGDYIDTVGTCFIFSEQGDWLGTVGHVGVIKTLEDFDLMLAACDMILGDKTDNIGKGVPDEPSKQYKGICGLQKKLKFRRFAAEDKTTSLPAHMKS